jgi:hypothetical protein
MIANLVIEVAYVLHAKACLGYPDVHIRGTARPFGVPSEMPPHRWRVSWDVMQALTEAAPPPFSVPNPKTADGPVRLLFGWPLDVDRDAPAGTMELLLAG